MKYKNFITEEQFYYLKDHNLLGALSRIIPEVLSIIEYEAFIDSMKYVMDIANKPVNWDFKEGTRPIHISWIIFGVLLEHVYGGSENLKPPAWFRGLIPFLIKKNFIEFLSDSDILFPHQGLWDYLVKKKLIDLDKEKIDNE